MPELEPSPHLSEAQCADLVLALLSDAEQAWALTHARSCAACEERLRLHTAAHARAAAAERLRQNGAASQSRVLPLPRWIWIAAAAALVAVIALPQLLHGPQREPQRWLPNPEAGITLREGESDPHLATGLAAYGRRDLGTATRELAVAQVSGGAETARRLYLANTLLALDEPEAALTLLQGIDLLNVPEPWQEEALWSLQTAYRQTGQEMRADSIQRARIARPTRTH